MKATGWQPNQIVEHRHRAGALSIRAAFKKAGQVTPALLGAIAEAIRAHFASPEGCVLQEWPSSWLS